MNRWMYCELAVVAGASCTCQLATSGGAGRPVLENASPRFCTRLRDKTSMTRAHAHDQHQPSMLLTRNRQEVDDRLINDDDDDDDDYDAMIIIMCIVNSFFDIASATTCVVKMAFCIVTRSSELFASQRCRRLLLRQTWLTISQ